MSSDFKTTIECISILPSDSNSGLRFVWSSWNVWWSCIKRGKFWKANCSLFGILVWYGFGRNFCWIAISVSSSKLLVTVADDAYFRFMQINSMMMMSVWMFVQWLCREAALNVIHAIAPLTRSLSVYLSLSLFFSLLCCMIDYFWIPGYMILDSLSLSISPTQLVLHPSSAGFCQTRAYWWYARP